MNLLDCESEYYVQWRNWGECQIIYRYDSDSEALARTGAKSDVAIEQGSTEIAFTYAGQQIAAFFNNGLIQAVSISDRIRANEFPRIEFVRMHTEVPVVLATLTTTGKLVAPRLVIADEIPDTGMRFFDKICLSDNGLIASELLENANFN